MEIETANCKTKVSECIDNVEIEQLSIDRPIKIDVEITGLERLIEVMHRVFAHSHVDIQDVQKLMLGYKSDPKDWRKYAKYDRFRYTRNLVDEGNGAFNIMILCWGPGHASAIHDHADSHCFMKLLSGSLEEIRYDWPDNIQPEVMKKIKRKSKRCCSESEDRHLEVKYTCPNDNLNKVNGNCQNNETGNCQSKETGNCQNNETGNCQNNETGNCQNGVVTENCQSKEAGNCQNNETGNCQNGMEIVNRDKEYDEYLDNFDVKSMKEIGRTRLDVNDVCYINDALGLHRMENPSHVDGAVSLHLYCPPFDSCRVFDAHTSKPTEVNVTFWSKYGKKIKRVMEASDMVDGQQ